MINVVYPPGCYGHFLSTCLYMFTDLSDGDVVEFDFSKSGNSHSISKNKNFRNKINLIHFNNLKFVDPKTTVLITACENHSLDYLNNQLYKFNNNQIIDFILNTFSGEKSMESKLTNFNNHGNWSLREFISFFLMDLMHESYNNKSHSIDNCFELSTNDIFSDEFINTIFPNLAKSLNLKIKNIDSLVLFHNQFKELQQFHQIQIKLDEWIDGIFDNLDLLFVGISILDEAYVQAKLRQMGYGIRCFELNDFPKTTKELFKLIDFTNKSN